jgi:SAM-dependent methyltransferase
MKQLLLSEEEVLAGYDAISRLYPYVPSLLLWRAWEYAAYRRFTLEEPVLDVGCGDGRYFRLVWPQARQVIGIDIDADVAERARQSGVYQAVYVAPAHQVPVPPGHFGSAFANCALEHMDQLHDVLASICASVRPGGTFLLSVVTDKLIEWSTLPRLVELIGEPLRAEAIQNEFLKYHHYSNVLTAPAWAKQLQAAGFEVLEHIPIVPKITSGLFLFLDQLWHVKRSDGEVGNILHPYLATMPQFPSAFRQVVAGFLAMDQDWAVGSGAVFAARRVA